VSESAIVRALYSHGELLTLETGSVVFRPGDPAEHFYVVVEGGIRVHVERAGAEITLGILGAGETFGEIAILSGGPRIAGAEAIKNSEVLRLRAEDWRMLTETEPAWAGWSTAIVAAALQRYARQTLQQMPLDLEGRIARLLLDLASIEEDPATIPGLPTQSMLARMVGASRQRVNHALRALEAEGSIRRDGCSLEILEAERLRGHATPGRPHVAEFAS
jgi:CRP-like cAMP-binding protein